MTLFFLAAGEGTRFRPHTQLLAKPALPFCGAPLLLHSYFLALELKSKDIVINTYHLPETIHSLGPILKRQGPPDLRVSFSNEQPVLLGSAGGMAAARIYLGDKDFIALNADEIIIPKDLTIMSRFKEKAQASNDLATLLVMKHPEAGKKFGAVWTDVNGRVQGFGKTAPESQRRGDPLRPFHFIGPMYFRKAIFERIIPAPSNILHDTLKQAIAEGESVGIFETECLWGETGNLNDYLDATEMYLNELYKGHPYIREFQKFALNDYDLMGEPGRLLLKHKSVDSVRLEQVRNFAVIGKDVKVGPGQWLDRVVFGDGTKCDGDQKEFKNQLFI